MFWQVNADWVGGLLLVIALVAAIWGGSLIHLGHRSRSYFDGLLGGFFLFDASLYLLLGITVLLEDEGLDLWAALYFGCGGIIAIAAFLAWARERRPAAYTDASAERELEAWTYGE